jgi:hypothetical protein
MNGVLEKQKRRMKLIKAVLSVYGGMTVSKFEELFGNKDEETIIRYLNIVCAERAQGVDL